MIQKHCFECGTALIEKELEGEGVVPYCPKLLDRPCCCEIEKTQSVGLQPFTVENCEILN